MPEVKRSWCKDIITDTVILFHYKENACCATTKLLDKNMQIMVACANMIGVHDSCAGAGEQVRRKTPIDMLTRCKHYFILFMSYNYWLITRGTSVQRMSNDIIIDWG